MYKDLLKKDTVLYKTILIATFLIIGLANSKMVKAASKCEMDDGKIIITITSKTATHDIRYRTIGFTVTTKKQLNEVSAKNNEGSSIWGPQAPLSPSMNLALNNGTKESSKNSTNGETTVVYTFSEAKVKNLMKDIVDLDKLSNNTIIYFNAIFETYKIVNSKEVKLNPRITTWEGIVNNQRWANKSVFKSYFNIEVEFKPGLQPNSLYYEVNNNICFQGDLPSMEIGQALKWNREVTATTTINKTLCKLVGYYAKSKLTGREVTGTRKMVGDKIGKRALTADDIINDSVKVLYGGMDIHMLFEPSGADIVIDAMDIDTGETICSEMYKGTVSPGEDFKKSIDNVITVNGITYNKTERFYYTFTNKINKLKRIVGENRSPSDPVEIQIPYDLKTPSTITVKVYYEKISLGNIPVIVNAINKDTGVIIQTLTTKTIRCGSKFNYKASESLSIDDTTYDYTGEWSWSYRKNTSSAPTVRTNGYGTEITIIVPTVDEVKDVVTVNVYYKSIDTIKDEIRLRVIMVSKTGDFIEEISREIVTRRQAISKEVKYNRTVGGVTYKYIDKWDYTYIISTGNRTKAGTGNKVAFTIPSTTKFGTVITLKLYYDASQSVEIPETSSPISLLLDNPSPYAIINGDKYSSPLFISKEGISTTESQHIYVKTKEYLLGYRLVNRTGKVQFVVPVNMTYTLQYYTATPDEYGGPQEVIDKVVDTQYIPVERAYSYWEIEELEYYIPSSANVYNYSLPNGKVNLTSKESFLNIPSLTTWHSSSRDDHIILPNQAIEGIELTQEVPITSETNDRPMVEFEDLTSYIHTMTGELTVKNDFLSFNGEVVLSDAEVEKISSRPNTSSLVQSTRITHDKVLFKEKQIINALKENGVYTSNGNVNYSRHPMSINTINSSKSYNISVNDVIIHTPVICDPIVNSDNDKWVQLINLEEEAYQIVLDPDTSFNDFTVRISNSLPHSNRLGYYTRDFSKSFIDPANISYIAKKEGVVRNEMKLPFDVYIDNLNDMNPENDHFIKSGNWIVLGRSLQRFYVPMWVQEGIYTAQFRTVAVNGEEKLSNTELTRNTSYSNYVATSTCTFQISGRVYGFTLYDISDDGRWKDIFRIKDTMMFKYFEGAVDGTKRTNYHADYGYYYTVGTKNHYGHETGRYNKYTLPLVNGSHPKYKNLGALKTGYAFRFMLDTTGEMYGRGCIVRITPSFYYIDEKGSNRQLVDIYYDEEIDKKQHVLVKAGEGIDLGNLQFGTSGNPYSGISEAELRHTAKVMGVPYLKIANQYGSMYSYSDIHLTSMLRTFIGLGYASHIVDLPSYTKVNKQTKENELSLSKYMQRWYGTYKLPTNTHVVPLGYDVYDHLKKHGIDYTEDFWLKDGYIIVNFNIETIDKNGNRNLSYINGANYMYNEHCSMWITEGAMLQKTDNKDATFKLKAGDVVLYYTDKKHSEDYIGIIY